MKIHPTLSNKYFIVQTDVSKYSETEWLSRASIVRRDTGELLNVRGIRAIGNSEIEALKKLEDVVKIILEKIGVPKNWGEDDQARVLISSYGRFKKSLLVKLSDLCKMLDKNEMSDDILTRYHHEIIDLVEMETIEFFKKVRDLGEKEKLQLVKASNKVYSSSENHLDDIYSINEIFKYIEDPSDELVAAHEFHLKKMFASSKK